MIEPKDLKAALYDVFVSPNEMDSNMEAANIVDGLFAIARALHRIGKCLEDKMMEG
jgi:hypothetical protein